MIVTKSRAHSWTCCLDAAPIRFLTIEGETQIRGYRVIVGLTGPLSQPQAAVRSEPALPQADVVSLITTGTLTSGDTSTGVLSQSGIGTATSLLTDVLINEPAQRATSKLFGLSRFEISPVLGGPGVNPRRPSDSRQAHQQGNVGHLFNQRDFGSESDSGRRISRFRSAIVRRTVRTGFDQATELPQQQF